MDNPFEIQQKLFDKGFACEIVLDGLPEFPCWRGCFQFYDKKGKLIQDDSGAYAKEQGGIQRAFDSLIKTYEALKDNMIDPNGFKSKEYYKTK